MPTIIGRSRRNRPQRCLDALPVLMLFQQNAADEQKWRGCPFWRPVLLTPVNPRTTLFGHDC